MNTFLVKCKCQHCNQTLEFQTARAGETVACPSCGLDTLLFIPQSGPLPALPDKTEGFKISTLWGAIILAAIVIPLVIVWSRLSSGPNNEGPGIRAMLVSGAIWMCVSLIGMLIYFAPSLVARSRGKRNFQAILVLNFLTGWTFIGWVIAMVWAVTVDPKPAK